MAFVRLVRAFVRLVSSDWSQVTSVRAAQFLGTQSRANRVLKKLRVSLPFGVFRRFWARWKHTMSSFFWVDAGNYSIISEFTTVGQRGDNDQLQGVRATVPNHI